MSTKKKRPHVEGASANRLGGLDCAAANFTHVMMSRQASAQDVLIKRALALVSDNAQIGVQMQQLLQGGAA